MTGLHEVQSFAVGDTNEERTREVARAYKHAADSTTKGDLTAEGKAQLQSDADFMTLKADVAALGVEQHTEIAKVAMKAVHGAGILFLNGKVSHDKFWKERAGARTESSIQKVFNAAVSVDLKGQPAQWGAVLPEGTAKKFVAGKFAMHWWNTLKPVVLKREGQRVYDRIDKRLRDKPASAVYTDEEALRLLETPARACMKLLGFGSSGDLSFASVWRDIARMAKTVENFPTSCRPAKGLAKGLAAAAVQMMQCPQDRFESMLEMPATAVQRVSDFGIEGTPLDALNAIDARIERIAKEVDDGMHGYGRDVDNNDYGDDDGEHPKKKPRSEEPKWKEADAWGSCAAKHGITANADGTKIAFGDNNVTEFATAPDVKKHCVACFAPKKGSWERSKWCPTPDTCWKGFGEYAHTRIDGFGDDACRAKPANQMDATFDWAAEMTVTLHAAKTERGNAWGGGGGGGGGKGRGGKGRGNKPAGGKGGGKGKGKSGKGSGGKGKGGKGFGRQSQ